MRQKLVHDSSILCVALSFNNQSIASGSDDGLVLVWDVSSASVTRRLGAHSGSVTGVSVSSDGKGEIEALASCSKETICVWNAASDRPVLTLQHSGANGISFSPNKKHLASWSSDQTVRIWNAETGQLMQTLEGHASQVMAVCYSEDGALVASGSTDLSVKIWTGATS